jgi:23S rRNA (cytosine1962-C5)-methyltransferase
MPTKRTSDRVRRREPGEPLVGEIFRQRPLAPDPAAPIPAAFVRAPSWHPFLYRKRIDRVEKGRPGDLVAVYGPDDRVLGYGLYNPRSEIAVRMVFYGERLPDDAAWQSRLSEAVSLRHEMLRLNEVTDAYRLIHAEADGLPGLVIDRLGDVLSAEAYTLGMYQRAEAILARLSPGLGTKYSVVRPSPQFLSQEGYDPPGFASDDLPPEVTIREYGTRFRVRFVGGHKTGFFCDQRENRKRLADFCEGRTVLDLCCYTGGFAVQAKCLGKAAEVTGVDLDEEPLKLARENANLNQARVRFVQDDVFAYMREMLRLDRRFDVVVLDPPKLIRGRDELEEGTRKHFDLNRLAMRLVKPGGLFLSCCCSGLLKEEEFIKLLRQSAYQAGELISAATEEAAERHAARPLQFLARSGAAADHPVSATVPETEYLKAVWMRVG